VNHHHVLQYAEAASPKLIWRNFAHLFSVSLMPFSTAWMARTRLAGGSVAFDAAVFVLVNVTCVALLWETFERTEESENFSAGAAHDASASVPDLGSFYYLDGGDGQVSVVGRGLVCSLVFYLRPEAPGGVGEGIKAFTVSRL